MSTTEQRRAHTDTPDDPATVDDVEARIRRALVVFGGGTLVFLSLFLGSWLLANVTGLADTLGTTPAAVVVAALWLLAVLVTFAFVAVIPPEDDTARH